MKANEFIKKYGIAEAKALVKARGWTMRQLALSTIVDTKELTELVESHEIVEYIGNDLDGAKQVYAFTKNCVHIAMRDRMIPVDRLKQAIADVESCQ